MDRRISVGLFAAGLAAAALAGPAGDRLLPRAAAQATPRAAYDFEDGTQGFSALSIKDGQLSPDSAAKVEVTHEKDLVKAGGGSLSYSYTIEPKVIRALAAEAKIPTEAQSVRLWVRSTVPTALIFTLREQSGATYQLGAYVPGNEWTPVAANLDELDSQDASKTGSVHPDQVNSIGLMDIGSMLASAPADFA